MRGHLLAMGHCYVCGLLFSFNPDFVPAIPVEDSNRPICSDCVEMAQRLRAQEGRPPFHIHPDAYRPT